MRCGIHRVVRDGAPGFPSPGQVDDVARGILSRRSRGAGVVLEPQRGRGAIGYRPGAVRTERHLRRVDLRTDLRRVVRGVGSVRPARGPDQCPGGGGESGGGSGGVGAGAGDHAVRVGPGVERGRLDGRRFAEEAGRRLARHAEGQLVVLAGVPRAKFQVRVAG